MERRNAWKTYTQEQLKELDQINDRYKICLDEGKTERECIRLTVKELEKQGYRNLNDIKGSLKTGDKVYAVCMGKSIAMFRIGKEPLENGMNILGAHIDSPRIDVKQNPLYENEELAYLDTHYYGGIKKYQWVTLPLALHGVIVKTDGTVQEVSIGEKEEDPYFTDDRVCDIVSEIHRRFADCAITLSIGEKSRESYQAYYDAGAERYLLRHETATEAHYGKLHPAEMSLANRKKCLFDLKEIGYQVGAGFMVDSPFQTTENLVADLRFLQELQPDMIGIGPYITHGETPFAQYPSGSLEKTLRMVSILRLLFPYALIPSTTALGTIHPEGRELGLKAGGNVVMPNLSPASVRKKYDLYENKICTGEEAAQCRGCLEQRVARAGYRIVTDRGDVRR